MTRDELIEKYEGMVIRTVNKHFWSYSRQDKEDYAQVLRMQLNEKYEYICKKQIEAPEYINGIISKILFTCVAGIFRSLNQKKTLKTTSLNQVVDGTDKELLDMLVDEIDDAEPENSGIIESFSKKIKLLNQADSQIIKMHFEEGLSVRAIEDKTGLSKSAISRKINKFRNEVKKDGL